MTRRGCQIVRRAGSVGAIAVLVIGAAQAGGVISGTVAYRERVALTPEAVLEITLEDVTAGAPTTIVAQRALTNLGQVPIAFELPFDPVRIVPSHRYNVRFRLSDRGALRFVSTEAYPVITGGHGTSVHAVLRAVAAPLRPTAAPFEDRTWRLVHLGGRTLPPAPGPRAPQLRFDATTSQVQGATGCNTITGSYVLAGESLTFRPLVTTRMHCPDSMEIEEGLLAALGATRTWRMAQGRFILVGDNQRELAEFEAVEPRERLCYDTGLFVPRRPA